MKKWIVDQDQSNTTGMLIYFMNTSMGEMTMASNPSGITFIVGLEHVMENAMVIIVGRE